MYTSVWLIQAVQSEQEVTIVIIARMANANNFVSTAKLSYRHFEGRLEDEI